MASIKNLYTEFIFILEFLKKNQINLFLSSPCTYREHAFVASIKIFYIRVYFYVGVSSGKSNIFKFMIFD